MLAELGGDGVGRAVHSSVFIVRLRIEEPGLGGGFGELREPDAQEPNWAEGLCPLIEEGFGGFVDDLSFVGLVGEGGGAGDGFEIAEADFDGDGLCIARMLAQARGDILALAGEQRVEFFEVVEVGLEGVFVGDGLCAAVDADGAVVDALGELVELCAEVAELCAEGFDGEGFELCDGADAEPIEFGLGRWAHADEDFDGERVEDLGDGVFGDEGVAVGLVHVGSEFGEELVGGDADGAGEVEFVFDEAADFDGDVGGRAEEMGRARHIEEGFINGDGLDGR